MFLYKNGWTPDLVIKFGCEVIIRSIHSQKGFNICVGTLITWFKRNCDEIFYMALPSIVVMLFLHHLLHFVLKSLRSTTKKGLFCSADSRFSWTFSLKD